MSDLDTQKRWRLILGKAAEDAEQHEAQERVTLTESEAAIDRTLGELYDAERSGGLGGSSPRINRWLGDIRKYFPTSVVRVMQKDALERLGLERMLLEPELLESIEPDVHLVGTLLSLHQLMPERTRETARKVVRKVVDDIEKKLKNKFIPTVTGALSRSVRNRRPKPNEIDWHTTIRANLKHYQPDYQTIIPERLRGHGRKGQALKEVILLVDESGSMSASVVYASVFGAVMASIRSLRTHFVVFDTAVVNLTELLHDPVELLFGTQLGGGTDINKALAYAQTLVRNPSDTILILISDLYEGGNAGEMLQRLQNLRQAGVCVVALLALSDEGAPAYNQEVAAYLAQLDIPAFACTPDRFADLIAAAIKGEKLQAPNQ